MKDFNGKPVFTTVFENKGEVPWRLHEDGKIFFVLPPGQTVDRLAIDPGRTYAPFSKVTYKKNGEVEVERNKDWTPPEYWGKDHRLTEFLNEGSNETEALRIDGELVECYRGIPRYWPIRRLNNEFSLVAKVVWQETTREAPDPMRGNMYLMSVKETVMSKTLRPKKEIEAIQKRLQDEAKALAEKESGRTMKRLTEGVK